MINITFAPSDQPLAERISADLSRASFKFDKDYLVVVATAAGLADESVVRAVETARRAGHTIVPLVLRGAPELPAAWADLPALRLRRAYQPSVLVAHLRRLELGRARLASNWRLFLWVGLVVGLVFAASLWGITSGTVIFPADEYATENAAREALIQEFTIPTLELLLPRSTQDAEAFAATVQAAPTRIRALLAASATAQPVNRQATLDAIETSAVGTTVALTATVVGTPPPDQP